MSNPEIAFASDIHFEFYREHPNWLPPLPSSADILILAGDIDIGDHAISTIRRIAQHLKNKHIIFVAGNHEFYGHDVDEQISKYREAFAAEKYIHFLENDKIELLGITFLGCTLWTGFDAFEEYSYNESLVEAQRRIADFHYIKHTLGQKQYRFLASAAESKFLNSKEWLRNELSYCDPEVTVVVTHFPPHTSLQHGVIEKDVLANYFVAKCDDLINEYQPKYWIYGHNHWPVSKQVGKTKLLSNQLGYPEEDEFLPEFSYSSYLR